MNIKKRLRHLAQKLDGDRQTGKTAMIAKAVEATGGVFIAATVDHARVIERTYKIVARSADVNLDGITGPFFMDNHAIARTFEGASTKIENLEKRIEELEKEIRTMKELGAYVNREI